MDVIFDQIYCVIFSHLISFYFSLLLDAGLVFKHCFWLFGCTILCGIVRVALLISCFRADLYPLAVRVKIDFYIYLCRVASSASNSKPVTDGSYR